LGAKGAVLAQRRLRTVMAVIAVMAVLGLRTGRSPTAGGAKARQTVRKINLSVPRAVALAL